MTGASSGIGETIARRLAAAGHQVALWRGERSGCFVLARPHGVNVDELVMTPLGQQW